MAVRTVTRADLASAVSHKARLPRSEVALLLDQMIDEMTGTLARGEAVRVSSFGAFEVRQKHPRMGRNPKTGEEVTIGERRVVTFKPSDVLKRAMNAGRPQS